MVTTNSLSHTSTADVWDRVISGVYTFECMSVCVRALKEKRLELSTPNLVHIYPILYGSHLPMHQSGGPNIKGHTVKKLSWSHGC